MLVTPGLAEDLDTVTVLRESIDQRHDNARLVESRPARRFTVTVDRGGTTRTVRIVAGKPFN